MNNVNPDNFNETMAGYFQYAIDFAIENKAELTAEQINLLKKGLSWAKSNLTMEDARRYEQRKTNQ